MHDVVSSVITSTGARGPWTARRSAHRVGASGDEPDQSVRVSQVRAGSHLRAHPHRLVRISASLGSPSALRRRSRVPIDHERSAVGPSRSEGPPEAPMLG
jgi:hypothetical protein